MLAWTLGLAMLAVPTLLGYGLSRLLVPPDLWSERWTLAPFVGIAMIVVVQDFGGFFLPASTVAWLLIPLAIVVTALSIWLRRPPDKRRPNVIWLLPLVAATALALVPNLITGGATIANLTNHDAFSYAVLHDQLAGHAYNAPPRPDNIIARYYLFLAQDFWRVGLTNLDVTSNTFFRQQFTSTFGAHLALFVGLIPVATQLSLRMLRPSLSPRNTALAALVTVLGVTPIFLATEAFYSQLVACAWFPLLLISASLAISARDRRSLLLAALLGAAALTIYPEMLGLVALPLLLYVLLSALKRQQAGRILSRAALLALLTAAIVPMSVCRIIASLTRLDTLHTGQWPAPGLLSLVTAFIGVDPDPGNPVRMHGTLDVALALGGGAAFVWLLVLAWRGGEPGLRRLLLGLVGAVAALIAGLSLRYADNGYVPTKAAMTAGNLVSVFVALGVATLLDRGWRTARTSLHHLAILLLAAVLLLATGRMVRRLLQPQVVLDEEILELATVFKELPEDAALLIEDADINSADPNPRIMIDHYGTYFFTRASRREAFPSPGTRSYLHHVHEGDISPARGRSVVYALQRRGSLALTAGQTVWQGPNLRLTRASGVACTAELEGFSAQQRDRQPGEPVLWGGSDGSIQLRMLGADGCHMLSSRMRSTRRGTVVELTTGTKKRRIVLTEAWKRVETLPWHASTNQPLIQLRVVGPPREGKSSQFALADTRLQPAGCARVTWGSGWYPPEHDAEGEFRWSAGQAELIVFAAEGAICYRPLLAAAAAPSITPTLTLWSQPGGWQTKVQLRAGFKEAQLPAIRQPQGRYKVLLKMSSHPVKVGDDPRLLGMRLRLPQLTPGPCGAGSAAR